MRIGFLILFLCSIEFAWAVEAISVFGENPRIDITSTVGSRTFDYNAYGTRQLGIGILHDKNWLGFAIDDPRDINENRTRSAAFEFRYFGENQWGLSISHFKNFGLYAGSNNLDPFLENRADIEVYSTRGFVLRPLNNPEYSIEDALRGLRRIEESNWAFFYGGQLSNTYLHGDHSVIPPAYQQESSANHVNGYSLGALVGIGGTYFLKGFYVASQLAIGGGPVYSTWTDESGSKNRWGLLFNSSVFDLALGYSGENMSLLVRQSSSTDILRLDSLEFDNLVSGTRLIFTYRL